MCVCVCVFSVENSSLCAFRVFCFDHSCFVLSELFVRWRPCSHADPVLLLRRSLPQLATSRMTLPLAAQRESPHWTVAWPHKRQVGGNSTTTGAQDVRGLWIIHPANRSARDKFPANRASRVKLLMEGISLRGHSLTPQNEKNLSYSDRECPLRLNSGFPIDLLLML